MEGIAGKSVLVTGASSGIGRHFAAMLAQKGARVVAAARRLDALQGLAQEGWGDITPVQMDVSSLDSVRAAVDAAEQAVGPIEILVNNAGVAHTSRATDITEADFAKVFDTNVKGSFFVAQAVGARMIERGVGGRIVNTASVAGMTPMPGLTLYCMSKAAVIQMTQCLAVEWARHGINVNALCPGYIETELNTDFLAGEAGKKVLASLPRRRAGIPSDLDSALLLLIAAEGSRLINGIVLPVDDGYLLA